MEKILFLHNKTPPKTRIRKTNSGFSIYKIITISYNKDKHTGGSNERKYNR